MTLPRTSYGLAAGLLIAAAVAWSLGGSKGLGAILGFGLGAFLGFLSVSWQVHCMRYRPERLTRAHMEGFAVKLGVLGVFALAFRFIEPLAQAVNWQAFLLAFAVAVLLVLPLSTLDLSRLLAARRSANLESRRIA